MSDVAGLALVITAREDILDDALRLAAAAGVEVVVSDSVPAAVPKWTRAPLILVGADLAAPLVDRGLPRRSDVLIISRTDAWESFDSVGLWRLAVELGADHVVELPDGERWLVDRLADVAEGPAVDGPVVCVVPGRGGAGASDLACVLALASPVHTLLIDADPLGGGLDVRMGLEEAPGLRWSDLASSRGRVSPRALSGALPSAAGIAAQVSVVSADRGASATPPAEAVDALVQAGRRGFGLTVVDCPRSPGDVTRLIWSRSRLGIVVVPTDLLGAVASASLISAMRQACPDVRVILRRARERGIDADDVARVLGVPVLGVVDEDKRLAEGELLASARSRSVGALADSVFRELVIPRPGVGRRSAQGASRRVRGARSRRAS